jgi:hypothetical protein
VGAKLAEGDVDQRPRRLGRVAPAGRGGAEDVTDLRLGPLGAAKPERQVAEHAAILAALDGE